MTLDWQKILKYDIKGTSNKNKNKLDFITIKNFWAPNNTMKKEKRQLTKWDNIFASHTSDEGLVSRI